MDNIPLGEKQHLTTYRKIAIASWRHPRDPSTYSTLDLPIDQVSDFLDAYVSDTPLTLTHFVAKVVGHCLETNAELNYLLRAGNLYKRKQVDVFITTLLRTERGKDLSGFTIRNVGRCSLGEVAKLSREGADRLRHNRDPDMLRVQKMVDHLPALLLRPLLRILDFFHYMLNVSLARLGVPRDSFGSVMITNIGALGIDNALIPLSPYSRCPFIVGIGKPRKAPVVKGDRVEVGTCVTISFTFDHRHADGAHGAHFVRRFQKVFLNPQRFAAVFAGAGDGE